jgi:predicted alpha/beta hydrolase family esterase
MGFLILHGLSGSGPGHWQRWLAERLREAGEDVRFPDLPEPDAPQLDAWLDALQAERGDGDVVVCHSLACCLWLHHRAGDGPPAERVLFVSPPGADAGVPEIAGFFPVPIDPALAAGVHLVCSDNDPYCPRGAKAEYAEPLRIEAEIVPGAGHINADAGFGEWPGALRWCYGAKNGVDT